MGPQVASLLVLLALLVRPWPADGRLRLNAISTVLREEQAPPENRSLWEPGLDATVSVCVCACVRVRVCASILDLCPCPQAYQCMSDLECAEGSYCHASTKGPGHARCQACRRRKRRCHRDGVCCPGNHCSHSKTCFKTWLK